MLAPNRTLGQEGGLLLLSVLLEITRRPTADVSIDAGASQALGGPPVQGEGPDAANPKMALALMQILLFEQARYCRCASKCSWFPSRADLSQGDSDGRAQRATRTMQLTG